MSNPSSQPPHSPPYEGKDRGGGPSKEGAGGITPEAIMAEELARVPDEPLLPIEKKLIVYSLLLGLVLLGVLWWLGAAYFPVTAKKAGTVSPGTMTR